MTMLHDIASHVEAIEGEVVVNGPNGVAYSMTPEAAAETSDRLLAGSAEAHGQRLAAQRVEAERMER